jgi:hypothetical protein
VRAGRPAWISRVVLLVVAALVVWRVLAVLGPAAMGAALVGWWRSTA